MRSMLDRAMVVVGDAGRGLREDDSRGYVLTSLVHGFVHETQRDMPRRGRHGRPSAISHHESAEVNAANRDRPKRGRRASWCS